MIRFAKVTPVCCFVAASALALAQPPAPPAPPAAPAAPTPMAVPAPAPPMVRVSPKVYLEGMPDVNVNVDDIQARVDEALSRIDFDQINEQVARVATMNADRAVEQAQEMVRRTQERYGDVQRMYGDMQQQYGNLFAFAPQTPKPATAPVAPQPPTPPRANFNFNGQNVRVFNFKGGSAENIYDRGQRDLDNYNFDQALDAFTEVANRAGARADAALYWKAYTLSKLGRKDDATAALNELHTKYANSRWLDDAKALEIEVKQSSGQKVTPESQSNDELKLLALNGLAQSDPDRALPALDKLLKGAQSPKLKKEAIFVLAQSSSPRAQQMLEQIARGSGSNPDMQLQAILYIGRTGKQNNRGQLLVEIYNSSSDQAVKRAVLSALVSARDKDHIVQLAKSEKNAELRLDAISYLGSTADQAEMWSFYQQETDPAVKAELLRRMSGNTDKLIEIARTEKDAKLRRSAIQSLGSVKAANTTDALVAIYGTEQDQQVKRAIISALSGQRNVQALIQLGRKETDPDLRRSIVRSVVDMHSPEATDFLQEILNK